jgi:hypothetical protein
MKDGCRRIRAIRMPQAALDMGLNIKHLRIPSRGMTENSMGVLRIRTICMSQAVCKKRDMQKNASLACTANSPRKHVFVNRLAALASPFTQFAYRASHPCMFV